MATRQYIGARYTPKFSGTYDNTQAYEALEVVDNGSGTTYIARKPVPPNTPLTNTEYWLVYGSSNGAILDLQNRVGTIETELPSMSSSIMHMRGEIDNINSDISSINTRINTLYGRKANRERNLLVLGNSYTQGGVAHNIERLYDNSYEKTEGGIGFVAFTGHSNTFETLLDSAISDAEIDNNSISEILIVSAVGDSVAYTEFGEANYEAKLTISMGNIFTKILNNFPNCLRVMITFAESRNQKTFSNITFGAMFAVHRLFKKYSINYRYDYLGWSGFNILFQSSFFNNDNVHPNAAGSEVIGNWIANSAQGHCEYNRLRSSGSIAFGYSASATVSVDIEFDPNIATFRVIQDTHINGSSVIATNNSVLLDTYNLTIPAPAPIGTKTVVTTLVNASNGSVVEPLSLAVMPDEQGCLKAQYFGTPSQSTATGTHYIIPALSEFTYMPS